MSNDIRKYIHRIYGIALSAVTVIVGARFIIACYGIYTAGKAAGGQIYSRAAVAEAFAPMAISVYLCLALVIGGFILHLALPLERKKAAPDKNRQLILQRLHSKTDLSQCPDQLRKDIAGKRMARRIHKIVSAALLGIFSLIFLVYACFPGRWPEVGQVTGAMVTAVIVLFACLLIPTGYTIFTAYFCRRSMDKEIELLKQASKLSPAPAAETPVRKSRATVLVIVRCAVAVVAIAFILYGFFSGGVADVIAKAAAICTECVGLG